LSLGFSPCFIPAMDFFFVAFFSKLFSGVSAGRRPPKRMN